MYWMTLKQCTIVWVVYLLAVELVTSESPLFKVCKTEECIKISLKMKAAMNMSIDPCEDFYRFVCGTYLESTEIQEDKLAASTSDEIEDKIVEELRETLTNKLPKNLQFRPFEMAQTFYKQCMDKKGIDALGLDKAKEWYKVFGGWPVLEGDRWDEESFDWLNTTLKMYRSGFGYSSIIDCDVFPNPENTSKRIIEIKLRNPMCDILKMFKKQMGHSDLGVDSEFLKEGYEMKIVRAYYKYMVDVAVMYGAEKERALKELRKSLDFEMKLAEISMPIEEMRNHSKLFNPMTVQQLQKEFPYISWEYYFQEIIPKQVKFSQRSDHIINIYDLNFFKELGKLLKKTPKRVLANYLLWRSAMENTPFLTTAMRDAYLRFSTVVTGVESHSERYKECVDRTAEMLDLTVSAMYVRIHSKPNLKPQAMDIVRRIHKEMLKLLSRVKWMDEKTRRKAIDKAHTMMFHVGFPDELLDNKKLEKYYEKMSLGANFFDSVNNIMEVMNPYDFGRLNEPFNKSDWTTHCNSHSVNAYYNPPENSIEIPAGILRSPFFSPDRPSYLNYGAIGYVIAHEMIHAFDDEGRQYDKNGNLFDWWDEKTERLYLVKAANIVREYSNFTVQEINMKMKGVNTQGENIADHAGARVAYNAYIHWASQNVEEIRLPHFENYTPKQMFWISSAHSWCTKYRPETLEVHLATGSHPPAEFRINGPFRYSKDFAKDFKCPVNSFMNPSIKYNVW